MAFSTYPAMMNAIDNTRTDNGDVKEISAEELNKQLFNKESMNSIIGPPVREGQI